MFRITNAMLFNNNLNNTFTNNLGMLKAQEELASGKRLNRLSDDPEALSEALKLRYSISVNSQYIKNIDEGISSLNLADSALDGIGNRLNRAKEISVSQGSAPATASTRKILAGEVESILAEVTRLGNTTKGSLYIFSGNTKSTMPFASGAIYFGSRNEAMAEIATDDFIGIGIDGSSFLAADLNPSVSTSTTLSSLQRGQGVALGSISIGDRAGNTATIDLSSASTIGDIINTINASSINVTASINSAKNGILITDNNSVPVSSLSINEVGGGNTASLLGLLADRPDSSINGLDLDPAMTSSTLLSQLDGDKGFNLRSIDLLNGVASGTVSLSSALTVGDVLNSLNAASSLNITASISSTGTSIDIVSNNSSTVAYALEVGTDTSASDLGISGGGNVIKSLTILMNALSANDAKAIRGSIELLDTGLDRVLSVRAKIGARVNRLEISKELLITSNIDTTRRQSEIEDTDMIKAASDLVKFQTAYRATLQASAKIIQPTLMDFIR